MVGVLVSYLGTIFAYGQTGCGKTHTMMGDPSSVDHKGIIPRAFSHIFGFIDGDKENKKFLVRCSYLEIYNESILDLLSVDRTTKLDVKEDPDKGIYVKNLTTVIVKDSAEAERSMLEGSKNRKTASTKMNAESSRSHSIFTLYVEMSEDDGADGQRFKAGKLHLVDLAGSERQSKTQAEGQQLKEAQKINLSLSALGNVISSLVDGKSKHIPYRDSKLTRLLQDSLGGNTKTVMVAAISPATDNYDETLSTLRYAARAKNIKNKPTINEDPKDALLREYEDEITKLKEALRLVSEGKGGDPQALLEAMTKSIKSSNNMQHVIEAPEQTAQGFNPQQNFGSRVIAIEELDKHKDKLNKELMNKDKALEYERKQKAEMEKLVEDMEKKLVQGGHALGEGDAQQAKEYREMQLEQEELKKRERELQEQQKQREDEMLMIEGNYQSAQEEIEQKTKIVKKLRNRYKASLQEVKDLEREHQDDKERLTDTIRIMERDLDFYKKLTSMMLKEDQMYKIKAKSQFDDENNAWKIPVFIMKQNEMNLPKLPEAQAKTLLEDNLENQSVEFSDNSKQVAPNRRSSQIQMAMSPN